MVSTSFSTVMPLQVPVQDLPCSMVALVGLVKEFKNLPLTPYEIADLAYVIEREDLEIRGGLQDQYVLAQPEMER